MSDELRKKAKGFRLTGCDAKHCRGNVRCSRCMADFAESLLPKWTYCEDRLPEDNGWYLISTFNGIGLTSFDVMDGWYANLEVIAWRPLPAPAEPKEAR